LSGRLSDKFGHLPFTTSGLALSSVALFLFSTVTIATPISTVFAYMMMSGAGVGLFVSPNMSSIMSSVPETRRGIASAFRSTFYQVGFVTSLNVAVLVMTFVIPYRTITNVISAINPVAITESDRLLFLKALSNTYFWLGIVNVAAIAPSILRGSSNNKSKKKGVKFLDHTSHVEQNISTNEIHGVIPATPARKPTKRFVPDTK
jgi:MFS family permease